MTTHPSRTHTLATTSLVVIALALGAAVGFVATGNAVAQTAPDSSVTKRSPLELARERLDKARRVATEAAERLAAAESRRGALIQEIAAAEAEIPRLRAHADDLRRMIRERAARLYVRSATPQLDLIVGTTSVVDAARATHLTATIGDHEESVAIELQVTARALEIRQVQLRDQRAELERAIAAIVPLRDALDKQLERASSVYEQVRIALTASAGQADVATGAVRCPVQGFVVFTDDFDQPRDGGTLHKGIDMPARDGTPVVAVVDGILEREPSLGGGNAAWLRGADDVSYYYAHFSRYEVAAGPFVAAGDVIGYVGSTGFSTGPHLHFEVHPSGGAAVNGYALLLGVCADETMQSTK